VEALIGIRGEIDDDIRSLRHGGGHFDIEHHFAVRALGSGGTVLPVVHRNCLDLRRLETEGLEVVREVGWAVAATQFDDSDGLACRWRFSVREVIQIGHHDWRVGCV